MWDFPQTFGHLQSFLEVAFAAYVLTGLWGRLIDRTPKKPKIKNEKAAAVINALPQAKTAYEDRLERASMKRRDRVQRGRKAGFGIAGLIAVALLTIHPETCFPWWIAALVVVPVPIYVIYALWREAFKRRRAANTVYQEFHRWYDHMVEMQRQLAASILREHSARRTDDS